MDNALVAQFGRAADSKSASVEGSSPSEGVFGGTFMAKKAKPEIKIKVNEVEQVYEFDSDKAPTNCTRCKTSFEVFGGHRVAVGRGRTPAGEEGWKEVICDACDQSDRIHAYKTTGEMSSRLVMEAMSCDMH